MVSRFLSAALALAGVLALAVAGPASARHPRPRVPPVNYHYAARVQQSSPWPSMRRDSHNTAFSPIVGTYRPGARPWQFRTGKGIFSTPFVGGDGTIYFGSADTWFYAVSPSGALEWKFKTGNLIDSAGFIGPWSRRWHTYPVAVPSGDTYLYLIRSDRRRMSRRRRIIWRFTPPAAAPVPGQVKQVNWWEGNAEPGPDGTIYAGNTGDAAYALHPNGTLKWVYRSIGPFWTDPAIAADGTSYWGALDLQAHALSSAGQSVWSYPTLSFVTSSPALSESGTLYIGSFDTNLYALNSATGLPEWRFQTGDDIYASPALDQAPDGTVRAIYIASTDGKVYAVSPTGSLLWSYDTGDVIRSSPVIGLAPDGASRIVYVGAGNGTVYALNAADGTRRWSYDTTQSTNPVLRDRNDLNGSPALSTRGVVIGGEDGYLHYVPYDYCLHVSDPRCDTNPGQAFAPAQTRVYAVTSGGNTQIAGGPQEVGPTTVMPLRLVVTRGGQTLDAAMQAIPDANALVSVSPAFPFHAELSGDGHYLFVVPSAPLTPGQTYTVHAHGVWSANGAGVGDIRLGGTTAGTFDDSVTYHVQAPSGSDPFSVSATRVSAFGMTRLSFPLPAFVTSVNQIGFDSYNLIVGALTATPPDGAGRGTALLWAIGARPGPHGTEQADPATTLGFALGGTYDHGTVDLSATNPTLTFSFGPVPVQALTVRATLSRQMVAAPGADIYGEVQCAAVPTYGPLLPSQRLCNNEGKLVTNGTFVTGPYARAGTANVRPPGLSVAGVDYSAPSATTDGSVVAHLHLAPRASYPAAHHVVSIVLVDGASGAPVGLDYRADATTAVDGRKNISAVTLRIPAGTALPSSVRAYVVSDVFPLASQLLP